MDSQNRSTSLDSTLESVQTNTEENGDPLPRRIKTRLTDINQLRKKSKMHTVALSILNSGNNRTEHKVVLANKRSSLQVLSVKSHIGTNPI